MPKRFYLATPCYQDPCPDYVVSMMATQKALLDRGYHFDMGYVQGLCYIHQARNWLVRNFLLSKCDEMIFIDSDIGWNADELARLCGIEKNVVGGAAPFRSMQMGFPTVLKRGDDGYPIGQPFEDTPDSALIEANIVPTAMLKITRGVFDTLVAKEMAPLRIERDARTREEKKRWRSFFDFETGPDEELGANCVEYGEDVTFCLKCTRAGFALWVDPRMTLRHWGVHGFGGRLDDWLKAERPNDPLSHDEQSGK